MRDRYGSEIVHWNGYAAVVHVGESRFVLAREKKLETIREYTGQLPAWLPVLDEGEGPLIEADSHRKVW